MPNDIDFGAAVLVVTPTGTVLVDKVFEYLEEAREYVQEKKRSNNKYLVVEFHTFLDSKISSQD